MAEDYDPTFRIGSRVKLASDTGDDPRIGHVRERLEETSEYGIEWEDTPGTVERIATISALNGLPQLVRASVDLAKTPA